jgi:glycosyltransferase involved in cell wall biosynthesis
MWLKVSIVAYATGSIPYINRHQDNIFIVEQGNFKGMAEKANSLLQDPDLRDRMENRSLLFAKEEFSLESNVKKLIKAYRTIIDMERSK